MWHDACCHDIGGYDVVGQRDDWQSECTGVGQQRSQWQCVVAGATVLVCMYNIYI